MRELMGPFRAAQRICRKRRATLILLIGSAAVLGISASTSYLQLQDQRRILDDSVNARDFRFVPFGNSCTETTCRFTFPNGQEFGPALPIEAFRFDPGSFPNPRPGEPPPVDEFEKRRNELLEQVRPYLVEAVRDARMAMDREFSPRRLFRNRLRMAGTLWGVVFAVLFAATLFGAEWRWSMWRTQLTHEPRRGRVLAGKIAALWVAVAAGFAAVVILLAAFDAVMRAIFDIGSSGGPGAGRLAVESLRALIGVEAYATLATAFTILVRSSMAGLGGPLIFLIVDGLVTPRWLWMRHWFPVQQIAALVPSVESNFVVSAMWFPRITHKIVCDTAPPTAPGFGSFQPCREILLRPIPQGRAALVLLGWVAIGCAVAWLMLRVRDVPQ